MTIEELEAQIETITRERDEARAALADATTEWKARRCECGADDFCKIAQERNEARAEVERLREECRLRKAERDQVERNGFAVTKGLVDESERMRAKALAYDLAYRRGAEAMREACMDWCKAWENNGEAIADALADLWIPEEP